MSIQLDLIGKPKRKSPRALMHVRDAGIGCAKFQCRCGYISGWFHGGTVTEYKRGLPCPACNPPEPRP